MAPRNLLRLLALAALCLTGATAAAKPLKIASLAPDGTRWMKEMRAGAEEIARRTEDRVTVKFYPGGVMGNDATVLRKMRAGQLQGGAFTGGGLAPVYPDIQIYSLPFLFRSYEEVDYVRGKMDQLLRAGMREQGLETVGISEGGFGYILSNTPVRRVPDLASKKVWLPEGDAITEAALTEAGVSPVPLALADVYTGLQTGLVDTVASTPTGAIAFQWHTKVQHLTDMPLSYLVGILVIDKGAFDQLAAGDREVVRQVMGDTFRRMDQLNRQDNAAAREALARSGVQFVTPTEEERETWRGIGLGAIRKLEGRNAYSSQMLQLVRQHLEAFRREHGVPGE